MNKRQAREYAIAQEYLGQYGFRDADLNKLHRAETSLHRIDELLCSVEMSEQEQARVERRAENIERRIDALCTEHGVEVRFNGDPRGGAVRLVLPGGESNSWDGETWEILW